MAKPKLLKELTTQNVCFEKETLDKLHKISCRRRISISKLIRECIDIALEDMGCL